MVDPTVILIPAGVTIALLITYRVGHKLSRRKFKSVPQAVSDEHATKDPLRGMLIRRLIGDAAVCILFTKYKLVIARLGFGVDATTEYSGGKSTEGFGDSYKLLIGKDEQTILKKAKKSFAIPLEDIVRVELTRGRRGSIMQGVTQVIDIATTSKKISIRTAEDKKLVSEYFSKHLPGKFYSHI
ncbi:MAG: hypothetical protein ABIH76_00480 [Candidatus Bathyarchaeota archaeon]